MCVCVQALEDTGCEPVSCVPVLGGTCLVDMALTSAYDNVAIQCDGPEHFSRSLPHTELGDAVVRHRLLHICGWHVVPVAHHLWQLWEGPEEQLMFLHSLIAHRGVEHILNDAASQRSGQQ